MSLVFFYNSMFCFTGTSGTQLPLMSNYFRLESAPDWHLYQYHIDFNPPCDSKRLRIALLFNHEELLGKTRAFDGMVLFLPKKLPDQVGLCSSPVLEMNI